MKKSKVSIALTALSVLVLLLVIANIVVGVGNQSLQNDVNERQQLIGHTMQVEALNRQLINVLASLALKNNDQELRAVLASAGVNLPTAAPASAKAAK